MEKSDEHLSALQSHGEALKKQHTQQHQAHTKAQTDWEQQLSASSFVDKQAFLSALRSKGVLSHLKSTCEQVKHAQIAARSASEQAQKAADEATAKVTIMGETIPEFPHKYLETIRGELSTAEAAVTQHATQLGEYQARIERDNQLRSENSAYKNNSHYCTAIGNALKT